MRHVLKKLSPDAIDGEGFAGILNGRVRFGELDRAGNPTRDARWPRRPCAWPTVPTARSR